MATDSSMSKLRKDYLKLSKAKLSKHCKALNVDTYGSKAVLVDLLMKEHQKKVHKSNSKHKKHSHTNKASKPLRKSPRIRRLPHTTDTLSSLRSHNQSNKGPYIRKRSKSIHISALHRRVKSGLSRRDLLKMSKTEIIKQCKLRNKNEMVQRIVDIEQLFEEKKRRNLERINNASVLKGKVRVKRKGKHRNNALHRSKSEDITLSKVTPKNFVLSQASQVNHGTTALQPLSDTKSEISSDFLGLECDFEKCISRRRLIAALKYYEQNDGEQKRNEERMQDFIDKYAHLLSDWHHILAVHFECKLSENYKVFNLLFSDIKKQHLLCDISECEYYLSNNHKMDNCNDDDIDLNTRFVMDLIANIHTCLVHSFDIGFRMRNYNNSFGTQCREEKNEGSQDFKYLYFDTELESFQGYYAMKRKEFASIKGEQRMKCNKYFTNIDTLQSESDMTDTEVKCSDESLSSMRQCNTAQIVRIVKDYFFAEIKSEILNRYKRRIIGYFEENDWNGLELARMTEISFVTELIIRCDNNKELKCDLAKMFALFDFTDFNGNIHSESADEFEIKGDSKDIQSCTHGEIMQILPYLLDRLSNALLTDYKSEIIKYFAQNRIKGLTLFEMKRKRFCRDIIAHCNNNRKLNHSFIIFYKEFFRIDIAHILSEISNANKKGLKDIIGTKKANKKRKKRGNVDPQFTSGYRFLYWQCYRSEKWFVHKKYSNIKEEILDNTVHCLSASKWDEAYNKAMYLNSKSEIIKNIKCDSDKWLDLYGIECDSPLKISHLLSLILYTDYIDLAFDFSKSFKKLSPSESNEQLRDRNGEFANWARCLREGVEVFGNRVKDSKIDLFYYGIREQFVFQSFIGRFYAPTSATTNVSVALMYAPTDSDSNGIILELQKYKSGLELTYFNCSLISNVSCEDEKLFFGGYRPLQFHSIRVVHKHENYVWFIAALVIFNTFLNGKRLSVKQMKSVKSIHYTIISQLCKHKASVNRNDNKLSNKYFRNTFPEYINQIFDNFCNKKKKIFINLKFLKQCYPGFKSYFTDSVSNAELKNGHKNKGISMGMTPETVSTKPKVRSNSVTVDKEDLPNPNERRRRRRHSFSGATVQTDVIKAKYLFQIFKYVKPIHVATEIEGLLYDLVPTLPNLLFIYKLNKEMQPMAIANKSKTEFGKSIRNENIHLCFIENGMYAYYLSKEFYVKHILQILGYFFNSKSFKSDKYTHINNSGITEILKWKYNIYRNKIKFAPEIYKYFSDKKDIHININRVKLCAEASQSLLHTKCKRLCFFNIVSSLFLKCERIVCYDIKVVSSYYLQQLLIVFANLSKKHCKLKHIVLYQPLKIQSTESELHKFKQKFVRNNWKMTQKSEKKNVYSLCFDKIVLRR